MICKDCPAAILPRGQYVARREAGTLPAGTKIHGGHGRCKACQNKRWRAADPEHIRTWWRLEELLDEIDHLAPLPGPKLEHLAPQLGLKRDSLYQALSRGRKKGNLRAEKTLARLLA